MITDRQEVLRLMAEGGELVRDLHYGPKSVSSAVWLRHQPGQDMLSERIHARIFKALQRQCLIEIAREHDYVSFRSESYRLTEKGREEAQR